jgi:hypothetical protein
MQPGQLQVRQHLCQLGPEQRTVRRHLPTSKHPTFTSYRVIDRTTSSRVYGLFVGKTGHWG